MMPCLNCKYASKDDRGKFFCSFLRMHNGLDLPCPEKEERKENEQMTIEDLLREE